MDTFIIIISFINIVLFAYNFKQERELKELMREYERLKKDEDNKKVS